MKKLFNKLPMVLISLISLVLLSGCSITDKAGNINKIDSGIWDNVFVKPVAFVMNYFTIQTGSFAIGIVITTIIIRTILFPIYTKSNDTSVKMQEIQPQIQKIQAKYAGKNDPESVQKMRLEMTQIYQENNVNMLAGCLMPFLQMPVFMAMYHSVARVPATYGYLEKTSLLKFLWLNKEISMGKAGMQFGLAAKDPYIILPILVVITAVLLQYITMYGLSKEQRNNPTMKMMMFMMPGMMFMFSVTQTAALSLYWVAGNIFSTLQILIVKKPFKKKL